MEVLKMRQTQNASKKDNRKSILVIGLLLLLVAVIGFGGYTLSKYVTKKSAQDNNAQVAKWGFTVTAENNKLFGDKYSNGKIAATDDKLTVKADSAGTNLVAPGTSGSMTFTVKGTAEVRAQISFNVTVTNDISLVYTKDNADVTYAPVKWTLKKGTEVLNADNLTLEGVKNALEGQSAIYEAGAPEITNAYTLEWAWALEGDDVLDTYLGTNGTSGLPADCTFKSMVTTINFSFDISVTQLAENK